MTKGQYDDFRVAFDYGTRTVSHQEIEEAIGYLRSEILRLQVRVLGDPCGSSQLQALSAPVTP